MAIAINAILTSNFISVAPHDSLARTLALQRKAVQGLAVFIFIPEELFIRLRIIVL